MNRRHWLRLVLASSASSLLLPPVLGRTPSGEGEVLNGLFFDPANLKRIRREFRKSPLFAELREELAGFDYTAEGQWMDEDLRYNDQLIDIARLGRTAEEQAFVALMTGDPQAEAMAIRAIREIMRFERWDFFLDGDEPIGVQRASQCTVAVAFVVDLMGDRLDPAERREWLETMWTRGCAPCYRSVEDIRHPTTTTEWRFDPESTFFEHRPGNRTDMNRRPEITFNTNLRAVPASALMIGTVAYEKEFGTGDATKRFMEMGVWGIEGFREFFKADGSYDEEVNYANYTAFHIAQAAIVLRRHGGPDLTDIVDWNAYIEFSYNMSMPTEADPYGVVNWGDSGNAPGNKRAVKRTAMPIWIAGEMQNGLAQGFALNKAGTHTPYSVMWYDPSVRSELPPDKPRLWVSAFDRVVARTGFGKEHLVVAMRSGPPSNHEHADRNSIIVKCFGEELITDPLRPPYSYSDPAWLMRLTEGHSAVLIDGNGHEHHNGVEGTNTSNAYARIVTHADNGRLATWVSDASQPYRLVDTDIRSVVRSMGVFYHAPVVVVVDRISKWAKASTVQSRFFGYNLDGQLELAAGDDGFTFKRPGAVLRAQTLCTEPVACEAGHLDIPKERARLHPFVDVQTTAGNDVILVTVLSMAPSGTPLPKVEATRQGRDFTVVVNGERLRVINGALHAG